AGEAMSSLNEPLALSGANGEAQDQEAVGEEVQEVQEVQDRDLITGPLDAPTEELEEDLGNATIPLGLAQAPKALPRLPDRAVVGGRYRVMMYLGSSHGSNVYRVTDTKGYTLCWACGSTASQEGDTYCVD